MRIAVAIAVLGMVLGFTLGVGPAGAALHDRDCLFPANPGGDAPPSWATAPLLVDRDCTGEMNVGADHDDWYYVNAPLGAGSARVCPTVTKNAPWNPDLEVWARPNGLPNIPFQNLLPAGIPAGISSNMAGCDSVTVPAQLNAAGVRLYVHVHQASGDGLYNLVVS